jgi:hypothetical protein
MRTLQLGSTGPEVGLLRRLLNLKSVPSPALPEANVFGAQYNGAMASVDFGPRTENAVKAFQGVSGIGVDGSVGPDTWHALGLSIDMERWVVPASQPTDDTCYAAAATMVLGPEGGISFNPGPVPPGARPDDHWAQQFAAQFNWQLEFGMTPTPATLVGYLDPGPFWIAGNMPFPSGPSYHALVVGSMWGDGSSDGTMLLIYDPWPPNVGEIYGIILGDVLTQSPETFRYSLHL